MCYRHSYVHDADDSRSRLTLCKYCPDYDESGMYDILAEPWSKGSNGLRISTTSLRTMVFALQKVLGRHPRAGGAGTKFSLSHGVHFRTSLAIQFLFRIFLLLSGE